MTDKHEQRIGIVGGGVLGMTMALRLAEAGHRVTIYESSDRLGGLADAWQLGDITWDRHYHVTLLSDSYNRRILKELDLDEHMKWVETKTGFFTDGKLYSMSSSIEFLLFPPLDLISKFRLGWTIFYGSKIRNWKQLEQIPVAEWLRRWSGAKTFEKIWLPLLRSKLGENYKKTSAAFIWATIARLYAARRTGLKRELFGYLPGGYGRMLAEFQRRLESLEVAIKLNTVVEKVDRTSSTFESGTVSIQADGESHAYDRVVVTLPSSLIGRICPALAEEELAAHRQIEYQGIVCASLLMKKPLADYYVTNVTDGNVPFTGVIEMTTLVNPAEFGGRTLVYLPNYLPADDEAFNRSDEHIQQQFIAGLELMYPDFDRDDILAFQVSRARNVMALSTLGYSTKLPSQSTSIEGLDIVNSAQIVNGTLNVNETVRLAEEAACRLLSLMPTPEKQRNDAQHV